MAPSPTRPESTPQAPDTPPSPLRQLALQGAAVIAVLSLAWPYYGLRDTPLPWLESALTIGAVAFILAKLTRQPWWWQLIHAVFVPLAWVFTLLNIDPAWFLAAFALLWLVFRSTATAQVPLYLTNATTIGALTEILRTDGSKHLIDLGAGIGSTIIPLARAFPAMTFTGVENAVASWGIGWLRSRAVANIRWHMDSLWSAPLRDCDAAYAFLSPTPMAQLWQKLTLEMKPGSLFISNSFPVPDVEPDEILELDDRRQTRLYCYRIPGTPTIESRSD